MVVAVDEFAEAGIASEHLGEDQRVERQQQAVVPSERVAENETEGDALRGLAPAHGRHTLDGMKASLDDCSSRREEALIDLGQGSLSLVTSATKLGVSLLLKDGVAFDRMTN